MLLRIVVFIVVLTSQMTLAAGGNKETTEDGVEKIQGRGVAPDLNSIKKKNDEPAPIEVLVPHLQISKPVFKDAKGRELVSETSQERIFLAAEADAMARKVIKEKEQGAMAIRAAEVLGAQGKLPIHLGYKKTSDAPTESAQGRINAAKVANDEFLLRRKQEQEAEVSRAAAKGQAFIKVEDAHSSLSPEAIQRQVKDSAAADKDFRESVDTKSGTNIGPKPGPMKVNNEPLPENSQQVEARRAQQIQQRIETIKNRDMELSQKNNRATFSRKLKPVTENQLFQSHQNQIQRATNHVVGVFNRIKNFFRTQEAAQAPQTSITSDEKTHVEATPLMFFIDSTFKLPVSYNPREDVIGFHGKVLYFQKGQEKPVEKELVGPNGEKLPGEILGLSKNYLYVRKASDEILQWDLAGNKWVEETIRIKPSKKADYLNIKGFGVWGTKLYLAVNGMGLITLDEEKHTATFDGVNGKETLTIFQNVQTLGGNQFQDHAIEPYTSNGVRGFIIMGVGQHLFRYNPNTNGIEHLTYDDAAKSFAMVKPDLSESNFRYSFHKTEEVSGNPRPIDSAALNWKPRLFNPDQQELFLVQDKRLLGYSDKEAAEYGLVVDTVKKTSSPNPARQMIEKKAADFNREIEKRQKVGNLIGPRVEEVHNPGQVLVYRDGSREIVTAVHSSEMGNVIESPGVSFPVNLSFGIFDNRAIFYTDPAYAFGAPRLVILRMVTGHPKDKVKFIDNEEHVLAATLDGNFLHLLKEKEIVTYDLNGDAPVKKSVVPWAQPKETQFLKLETIKVIADKLLVFDGSGNVIDRFSLPLELLSSRTILREICRPVLSNLVGHDKEGIAQEHGRAQQMYHNFLNRSGQPASRASKNNPQVQGKYYDFVK